MGRYGQMRPAVAPHGLALFAALLFATAIALGVMASQRGADRAAPAREPPGAHPDWQVIAAAQREGLVLELRLPSDRYVAGEVVQAEVLARNGGPQTVTLSGLSLEIRDQQGRRADPGPGFWLSEWITAQPSPSRTLPAGSSLRETRWYRVPPDGADGGQSLGAWAVLGISHAARLPGGGGQPAGGRGLEAGPIPLQIAAPTPAQQLRTELQADRQGWRLKVTDGLGRQPAGPFWGEKVERSPRGRVVGPLPPSADGTWSGAWPAYLLRSGGRVALDVWVAAPGYVSVDASTEVAGTPRRAD